MGKYLELKSLHFRKKINRIDRIKSNNVKIKQPEQNESQLFLKIQIDKKNSLQVSFEVKGC